MAVTVHYDISFFFIFIESHKQSKKPHSVRDCEGEIK